MQRLSLKPQEETSQGKPNIFTAPSLAQEVPSILDEALVLEVVQGRVGTDVQTQRPATGSKLTLNRAQRQCGRCKHSELTPEGPGGGHGFLDP